MLYCLKEYNRPNQKIHNQLTVFESHYTLMEYLKEMLDLQRQARVPSVWRIETMDCPIGATEIFTVAHYNEMTALNRLWGSLVHWQTGDQHPLEKQEGGKKIKNKK